MGSGGGPCPGGAGSLTSVTHRDETAGAGPHEQHAPREGADGADGTEVLGDRSPSEDAPGAPRGLGGRVVPRLGALVPARVLDRGRAARATVDAARSNALDLGRRLRTPGAIFGPPPPAVGVPTAQERAVQRSASEVATLLPRSFEVLVTPVKGAVEPLGWSGEMYLIGGDEPRALVRQAPAEVPSKGEIIWGIVDELVSDVHSGEPDLRVVELVDLDGRVLLRSTPDSRRVGEGRVVRGVTLADGTPVAELVSPGRRARSREVVPTGTVRAAAVSTEAQDLGPHWTHAARVWRGLDELASTRQEGRARSLRIGRLGGDDEALLVWAGVLCWWGRGIG
ncbi:MAG: hypothetical protein K0R97_2206 [Oerskovia sp.]|nr:hypothetical protein [Oerskovia sp.]